MVTEAPQISERPQLIESPVQCAQLSLRVLTSELEFLSLESEWRRLSIAQTRHSPTSDWAWLLSWWKVIGSTCPKTRRQGQVHMVVIESGSRPVAIFPFVHHKTSWWEPRRLRPMGYSGEFEPSGLTEEPVGVWTGTEEKEAKQLLESHLQELITSGRYDCAIFRHLTAKADSKTQIDFRQITLRKVKQGPWIIDLPNDWSMFRKQLSKSMRDNLPYYPKLLKRAGLTFEIRKYTEESEVRAAVDRLIDLHKQRVHSEQANGHRDYFAHGWEQKMLEEGICRMAADGKGFIASLVVGGEEVAMQTFLTDRDRLVVHYSGFAPSYAKYSPLLILQSEIFKEAMQQGITEVDLLFGSAQWQKRWGARAKEQDARTTVVSTRPIAVLRCGLYLVIREMAAMRRRRGLKTRNPKIADKLSALAGAGLEFHAFAIRTAASPVGHHLLRVHR